MSREAVHAALFARVAQATGVVTASRRLTHWSEMAPAQQPALFQVQKGEEIAARHGLPLRRKLSFHIYLYAASGDPAVAPSSLLNPLLDALEAALAPDPGQPVQNLGGLAEHVWIAGSVETDEGTLGDQAVAIVPVEILLP
jgi:hypothetical protein